MECEQAHESNARRMLPPRGLLLSLLVQAPSVSAVWLHIRFVLPEESFLRERLGVEYLLYARGRRIVGTSG